eukprot:2113845-Amphidinium_carterae.1
MCIPGFSASRVYVSLKLVSQQQPPHLQRTAHHYGGRGARQSCRTNPQLSTSHARISEEKTST